MASGELLCKDEESVASTSAANTSMKNVIAQKTGCVISNLLKIRSLLKLVVYPGKRNVL